MRYEVFTLGKHFLQVHTSKGFTLFANAKLNPDGEVVSYTDTLVRRGGSWVIDCYKFLTVKEFPQNPIYCAVFGFEEDDQEVRVNATDIDVESISGVNGQLVDVGNISVVAGQSLPVNSDYIGKNIDTYKIEYVNGYPQWPSHVLDVDDIIIDLKGARLFKYAFDNYRCYIDTKELLVTYFNGSTAFKSKILEISFGDNILSFTCLKENGGEFEFSLDCEQKESGISPVNGLGLVTQNRNSGKISILYL